MAKSPTNPSGDDFVGRTIAGRYRIISKLGAGGMGVAYRAWDEQAGVPVVIKIPKKVFFEDPKFAERFQREIRLLQGLSHPHIVPILDVGEHEGLPFVVMRFLPGGSLSNRRLRDESGKVKPNPPGMLYLWLPAVAAALDHIHAQGVVHRDVKPANIFFDAFWGAFLGDFGIAKIVEESEAFEKEQTLTATHMGIGTQEYMGPEQFTPKAVIDGRADQYALAVTAYEMLAGVKPFTGATAHLIVEVTTQPVPPLQARRPDLPASMVNAVHRGLAKQPAARFATCAEFAAAALADVQPIDDDPDVARLLCPKCANILKLPTSAGGQQGKCPKCQTRMKVAENLGALWLLDEARLQSAGSEAAPDRDGSGDAGHANEDSAEIFKPVSSTTPFTKAASALWKPSRSMGRAGVVAAGGLAAAAGLVWFLYSRPEPPPPGPPTPPPVVHDAPAADDPLAAAVAVIKKDPDNAVANAFLGRHWCFEQRDWNQGLPHLAKSGLPGLATAARKELDARATSPPNPGELVRVAKAWWQVAGRQDTAAPEAAAAIKAHAADLYREQVGSLATEADVAFVTAWLDEDGVFRGLVGDVRPAAPSPSLPEPSPPEPSPPEPSRPEPPHPPNQRWPADAIVWQENGHAYKVFKELLSWQEAQRYCAELGGHLATVTSEAEQGFVLDVVKRSGFTLDEQPDSWSEQMWLGGTDDGEEGRWRWVSGEAWGFAAWHAGQPDNRRQSDRSRENFLTLAVHGGGKWNDVSSRTRLGFVCEWSAPSIADEDDGRDVEAAIDRALAWFVQHQLADGSWSFDLGECPNCGGRCSRSGNYADRAGATAMALLPFLRRGFTHKEGPHQRAVARGLAFLVQRSNQNRGVMYSGSGSHSLYVQGLATMALCECYGMTRDRGIARPTQFALDHIMAAQDSRGGGWRYQPGQPGDTSATGWQIMALDRGHAARLRVNRQTVIKAVGFLDSVQSDGGAVYGYADNSMNRPSLSAVGLLCRMHLGWKKDNPAIRDGVARLSRVGPTNDLYYDYYATQIMHHMGGDAWVAWNRAMKDLLIKTQSKQDHEAGSWIEGVDGSEHAIRSGGRLYCTSMATMILAVPRQARIYEDGPAR